MDTRRKQAKQKKRERMQRDKSRRRDESRRLSALLLEVGLLMDERDWPAAERTIRKALTIRPGNQESRERLIQICVLRGKREEALAEFERLEQPPLWPYITFLAADAGFALGQFQRAGELAAQFLREAQGYDNPHLELTRQHARLLRDEARKRLRAQIRSQRATASPSPHAGSPVDPVPEPEAPGIRSPRPASTKMRAASHRPGRLLTFQSPTAPPSPATLARPMSAPVAPATPEKPGRALDPPATAKKSGRAPDPPATAKKPSRAPDPPATGEAARTTVAAATAGRLARTPAVPAAVERGALPPQSSAPSEELVPETAGGYSESSGGHAGSTSEHLTRPPHAARPPLPAFPEVVATIPAPVFDIPLGLPAATLDLPPAPLADGLLACRYATLRLERGFDQLLALKDANVEHLWYQIETVRRTLRDFRGRVLLADEVGLGKTIEACLVLKEYWSRGLVRRALVLTPPSLVSQWVEELRSRVHLEAATPESGGYSRDPDRFWGAHPLVVASTALARQAVNRERLAKLDYDLVIVDEAHVLKNRSAAAWQTVNQLKKRYLLLLSATPVGNDLTELYNLILLLRPGLLSTEARFRGEYGRAGALADVERRDKLRTLLREVMVRNTRARIDLKLPRRLAATTRVVPGPEEARLLADVDAFVRGRYGIARGAERWALTMMQMQAGSSPRALAEALARLDHGDRDEIERDEIERLSRAASAIRSPAKTKALTALLARSPEKKIVFTRFLATLADLRMSLEREGCRVAVYHGGLTRGQKDEAIGSFERDADVLLASEVGGEGRNLQFCRTVINFDLPWNPMAIEQRVGRVHRIGQTREVYVFNFCLAGSVEEYVLRVLHEKVNLFELVAGEMEMILGELSEDADFSTIVMDLWAASATMSERDRAFDLFAEQLAGAKLRYDERTATDKTMFREDYEV
jgi:superfamily II DNA or RNA helicase